MLSSAKPFLFAALLATAGCMDWNLPTEREPCHGVTCSNHGRCVVVSASNEAECICHNGYISSGTECLRASDGDGDGDSDMDSDLDSTSDSTHDAEDDTPVCQETTTAYTESTTVVIPEGASVVTIKAWGAGGNDESLCSVGDGGVGGFSLATFAVGGDALVSPGTIVTIVVGQRLSVEGGATDGFGGAGAGGLSGAFLGGELLEANDAHRALVVAGGGGSAARRECGYGGPGNHPTAGGMATMQGQNAANSITSGGGGYQGGTAGDDTTAGMGGTGFCAAKAASCVPLHTEPGVGVPPGDEDPDYQPDVATTESPGLVVVSFICS